ncbi:PREDICTED: uncharacterized protein LOC106806021 [Priapulus caudatus]|uniref:Uncharacterized protein LOC106806021 n=1 Tax=Priapulus caudatus TaxID=37621 RepID=A0ABM1DTR3_PRICU|nr:PREDICTED: uncharacterized protein LOC106806021 [Priapulus caudatus]
MRIYVILFSIGLCFHSASQILADDADDDRMARMRDAANTLIGMTRRGELGAALMPNLGRGSADSADSRRNSENRVRIRAATRHIQDVAGHVQRMLRRLSTTTSQPMLQMLLPYLIESTGVVDGRDSRQMVQIGTEVLRMLREPMGVFAMSPVIMPLASQLDPSLRMLALEMMGTRGAPLGTRSVTSNEDVSLACEKLTCTAWEDKSFCSATCQNGPGFKVSAESRG